MFDRVVFRDIPSNQNNIADEYLLSRFRAITVGFGG